MRRVGAFLCGITAAILMTGCGSVMPDLTEEETEIISEYAAGVLLKYDRVHGGRLMSEAEYEAEENKKAEREAAASAAEQQNEEEAAAEESAAEESTATDTAVVDVSQDAEVAVPSTIEEYYDIQDITFQYTGYELTDSYPSGNEGDNVFFAMDATEGMQLLVLKFTATNVSSADQTLDMIGYGARFKVSVNGGSGENALSTMLLNDLQNYKDVIPAGTGTELVSIVEVPQATTVESIDFILRGDAGNSVINLQ